jgi:hypothetical protein
VVGTWRPGQPVTGDDSARLPLPALPQYPAVRGYRELAEEVRALGFRHAVEPLHLLPSPAAPHGAPAAPAGVRRPKPGAPFRVLDGLWLPLAGGFWQRVNVPYVRWARGLWAASADSRAGAVARLLDTFETILRDDPMGLRRVVLWQLCTLLTGDDPRPLSFAAQALGLDGSEAVPLAAAVAAGFPAARTPAHTAAEQIGEVWPGTRLRQALRLAADLPAHTSNPTDPTRPSDPARPADHVLARLLDGLASRHAAVERLKDEAARLLRSGKPDEAVRAYLSAVRQATDDPDAHAGLLAAAARAADDAHDARAAGGAHDARAAGGAHDARAAGGAHDARAAGGAHDARRAPGPAAPPLEADGRQLAVTVNDRAVRLGWRLATVPGTREGEGRTPLTYRLRRFPQHAPHEAVDLPVLTPGSVRDNDAPVGQPLRYAVLPMRGERIAGPPRASGPVVLTPGVGEPSARAVPGGLRLEWRCDPSAVEVRAVRLAVPGGPGRLSYPARLACGREGLEDHPLPEGEYRYEVSCAYRGPGGELIWSQARMVTGRARRWPTPVPAVSVRRGGEAQGAAESVVTVVVNAPANGAGRLVRWAGLPAEPGEDVSKLLPLPPVGTYGQDGTQRQGRAAWLGTAEEPGQVDVSVPKRTTVRVTAVSVLDDLAVAGPSVLLENPGSVEHLTVARMAEDRAEVRFDWPDPAVLVLLRWRQLNGQGGDHGQGHTVRRTPRHTVRGTVRDPGDGGARPGSAAAAREGWRRVSRSEFLDAGGRVEIPASGERCLITASPVPRPDAVVIAAGSASAQLPPQPLPVGSRSRLLLRRWSRWLRPWGGSSRPQRRA